MQDTQVSETKEFRCFYFELIQSKKELKSFDVDVTCYRGAVVAPKWKDVDPCWYLFGFETSKYYLIASIDNYAKLCTIEADLSHLPLSPRPKYSGEGTCYQVNYDVVLLFGLTEFKAVIAWKENVGHLMVH
jgi:hypothetical protein